jgi:hypothetical protein
LFGWLALSGTFSACAQITNLVVNGSFESDLARPGAPDAWAAAGNPAIKQRLLLDAGRDGRRCAKLECTEFSGDGPDFHVMICQQGQVQVTDGRWYRLGFRAKAQDIKAGSVEVALTDTRRWQNAGLAEAFCPRPEWQQFELLFRATEDLPAPVSRLQFWFKGTGTLWLDDVELAESAAGQQWYPQLATEACKNLVPNSSFECGGANWGSFTWGLQGWAGNLYRLEAGLDAKLAHHGQQSMRISLGPERLPVFWFDYYEPIRQPVRRVLVANQGWLRVKPGEPLTLSAYLRADAEGAVAQMALVEAPAHTQHRQATIGTSWQRCQFTFTPNQPFVFVALGLDLEASKRDAATLWLDAIQLERGRQATAYEPCQPVESFIETGVEGNVFTNVNQGTAFTVRAFNNADQPQTLAGQLALTDFRDATAFGQQLALKLPAHGANEQHLRGVCRGQRGFFRANWAAADAAQTLRCAIIEPAPANLADSPFGFNHAYPWDFLVREARLAGVVWWRDWSAKWQTVEPQKGRFDFRVADEQIQRVLALNGQVEVLLPFPSASWSTTARMNEVEKEAGNDSYLRARLPLAYPPQNRDDFGNYAAQVARHYRRGQPRPVTTYQILNEPVYTDYALPRRFGYTLADYLRLLETAYRAMKAAEPECRIVGGISTHAEAALTRDFVTQGGLGSVDVLDLHLYDPPRPAESYEESFSSLRQLMRAHGGPKPLWITEWGCYADDDPPCLPQSVGDATMNRCRWSSERAATEHIVKFTAVAFAHGVRKLFFHAGTCGTINGPDAGGVLFEYGGAPRKMYPGVAALTSLLGVPDEFLDKISRAGVTAYVFRVRNRAAAIAWRGAGQPQPLRLAGGVRAYDLMGNPVAKTAAVLGESPIYVIGAEASAVVQSLSP